MKLLIEIPDKMYHKINVGLYDYGDLNVIIQNGTPLDKIRGEIKQEYKDEFEHPYGHGLRRAIEIIDKYKVESEEE